MTIKIYGSHTPMFLKPLVAAEELGLPYQVVFVDVTKGEQRSPEHLKCHPFGKVPALEHDGLFLIESNTIMRYLGSLAESPVYPKEARARAQVDQWIDYFSLQLGRWITSTWFQKCVGPQLFGEKPDEKLIEQNLQSILEELPVVEASLGKQRYIAGDTFTLADVNAYMLCRGAEEAEISLSDFPHFKRWLTEIGERASVKKIFKAWW